MFEENDLYIRYIVKNTFETLSELRKGLNK